ncbi:unnamed protein product, partial [Ectocarpus sp. 12 AP-2014]
PTGGTEITHQPFYDPVCGYHSAAGFPMANSYFVPQRPPSRQFSLSSTLRDGAMVE